MDPSLTHTFQPEPAEKDNTTWMRLSGGVRGLRTISHKGNLRLLGNIGSGNHRTSGDERKKLKNRSENKKTHDDA